jgi:hypothetical protein
MLMFVLLSIIYADCHIQALMGSVIMLDVIMLSVSYAECHLC